MRKMRKWLAGMLVGVLAVTAVGCNGSSTEPAAETEVVTSTGETETEAKTSAETGKGYTAGTYTAVAPGNNGDVTVEVEFSETEILSVEVIEHGETEGLADPALSRIPAGIVDSQSLAIDTVSGATVTSNAILAAVEECVNQAGGDVAALKVELEKGDAEVTEMSAQLVIVGAGAAGMTAAVEASKLGLDVLVLEKGASVGVSNGAVAGGPAGATTTIQEEEGEDLTPEALFNHMFAYSHGTVNASLLRKVVDATGESIQLFIDLGVETYLRPDNFGIGFRARHGFRVKGTDRMEPLQAVVEENGGRFLFETAGEQLITNADGDVVGIQAVQADGTILNIQAEAVLLSTGGYLGSEEMLAEHFGNVKINPLGSTLSTGDGIRMTLEAGGVLDRNWGLISNEFGGSNEKYGGWMSNKAGGNENLVYPIYGGLIVNQSGKRFFNEEIMATLPLSEGGESVVREGKFFSVIDQAYLDGVSTVGIYDYLGRPEEWIAGARTLDEVPLPNAPEQLAEAIEQGWGYKADTIEELAEYFGLTNLADTVEAYNEMCANGHDTQFDKASYLLTAVDQGPFYVFEYEPSAWGTLGGVKVDDNFRALDENNDPIKGLYIAGVDAGSLYCVPYYDNEGAAFGLALGSGTVSAREIAEFIKSDVE